MVAHILTGLIFGVWGFLVADVITQPGQILRPWARLIAWLFGHERRNPADWNILQRWAYSALYGCSKCISGFSCLIWFCISIAPPPSLGAAFYGFASVTVAIFTGHTLNRLHESGRI